MMVTAVVLEPTMALLAGLWVGINGPRKRATVYVRGPDFAHVV